MAVRSVQLERKQRLHLTRLWSGRLARSPLVTQAHSEIGLKSGPALSLPVDVDDRADLWSDPAAPSTSFIVDDTPLDTAGRLIG